VQPSSSIGKNYLEPELVYGGPRGGHQPLAEPCMGIVGCVKNGPKKATYESWEGSAAGRRVETLRSVSEKKKERKKASKSTHLRMLERISLRSVGFR
jgi:hypothetical protein